MDRTWSFEQHLTFTVYKSNSDAACRNTSHSSLCRSCFEKLAMQFVPKISSPFSTL